jgi:selenocysteine lyase/cysteine desulfurase
MIVSNLCHGASAASWIKLAQDLNIAIKWWAPPPGDDPCLSLETLKPLLTPKTRIVACNHVSNVVGTIHPIRQVADMVHRIPGAVLIVDGVAFAPHRPIDVKALDVDFYCFSWYKVFGPHVAQLYGRRSVQNRLLSHMSHYFLSSMPGLDWRLRLGANSFELEAALVPITRYLAQVGWNKIIAQETVLQDVFLSYLKRRPRVFRIFGEKSSDARKRVPVITFAVIGQSCLEVTNRICRAGRFRVVSGNCWAPRPTHDVLGLGEDGLIRVSFVHYNTVAEVREFCVELDGMLRELGVQQ